MAELEERHCKAAMEQAEGEASQTKSREQD
jgi:hypothetical protein